MVTVEAHSNYPNMQLYTLCHGTLACICTYNYVCNNVCSQYLYSCAHLFPIHIHPCKYINSFQQYYCSFDCTLKILVHTHQYLNER